MTAVALAHRLDRTLVIQARPETVFQFFTDTPQWAAWWGSGSTIDARPGGRMFIRHHNGVEVLGQVLEVRAPERIVFTYGCESGKPVPLEGSRVTIRLDRHPKGTLLQLTHEFADVQPRDEHVQGWRFQLSLFANVIADTVSKGASALVDQWFATWSEPDAATRERTLAAIAVPDVQFGDKFSCLDGAGEVNLHLAAARRFALEASCARTTTLGSVRAIAASRRLRAGESFLESPSSRTVQARTCSAGCSIRREAIASSNPPLTARPHKPCSANSGLAVCVAMARSAGRADASRRSARITRA